MKVYILQFTEYYYDEHYETLLGVFNNIEDARSNGKKYLCNQLKISSYGDEEAEQDISKIQERNFGYEYKNMLYISIFPCELDKLYESYEQLTNERKNNE